MLARQTSPVRICVLKDGRYHMHTTMVNGNDEFFEEFDARTGLVVHRMTRRRTLLGKMSPWEIEVGDLDAGKPSVVLQNPSSHTCPSHEVLYPNFNDNSRTSLGQDKSPFEQSQLLDNLAFAKGYSGQNAALLMRESPSSRKQTPVISRIDTPDRFEWRVRNIPHDQLENFKVNILTSKQVLAISTLNKKYYKELRIPDLHRQGIKFDASSFSSKHGRGTIIISYKKPTEIQKAEKELFHAAVEAQLLTSEKLDSQGTDANQG